MYELINVEHDKIVVCTVFASDVNEDISAEDPEGGGGEGEGGGGEGEGEGEGDFVATSAFVCRVASLLSPLAIA